MAHRKRGRELGALETVRGVSEHVRYLQEPMLWNG